MTFRVHIKTEYRELDLREVLQSPPAVLLGVSDQASLLLTGLGVSTVYDLALSSLFGNATRVVRAAGDPHSIFAQHGSLPADILDTAQLSLPIGEVPALSTSALRDVGPAFAQQLDDVLGLKSIRDLAFWPPCLAARKLLVEAYTPEKRTGYDPEAPSDLVPRSGEHATQRVRYSTTVLIRTEAKTEKKWGGGPIDITTLFDVGFSDVAFGAILNFSQTWAPRAVALGQLLHSLPLAPGESTRLTVVDWTRRVSASTEEEVVQSELLTTAMQQSTAINEITTATARESQAGTSSSFATGGSASASTPGLLGLLGIEAGGGASAGAAATYTTSNANRSMVATAAQAITSRTQQNASATRNRRAAIVSEVSERDSESISTRVVMNNNHMHALSVQYYEVVQAYETTLHLDRIERCIFLPMRQVNFRNESIVRRYLPILVRAARDRATRDLLLRLGHTTVLRFVSDRFGREAVDRLQAELDAARASAAGLEGITRLPSIMEKTLELAMLRDRIATLRRAALFEAAAARRRGVIEDYDRADAQRYDIERDAILKSVAWADGSGIAEVHLRETDSDLRRLTTSGPTSGFSVHPQLQVGIPFSRLASLSVVMQPQAGATPSDLAVVPMQLLVEVRGRAHWLPFGFVTSQATSGDVLLLQLEAPVDLEDVADRLMAEQLYYSQQVWRRANRHALLMQLAGVDYEFPNGDRVRVVDFIDPTPVAVAGNYLGFRFTYEKDKAWSEWKAKELAAQRPHVDLVPVPTGGVFAEAVLSEAKAAEKLDATRFWRWEESPIPNVAPAIAETQQGQERRIEAPTPGRLPDALITLGAVPALPALGGSESILKAIAVSKLFNDMSGGEITSKLLEASLKAAKEGDVATMTQANETLAKINEALAGMAKSAFEAGPKLIDTAKGLGSMLNLGGGSAGGAAGGAAPGGGAAGAGSGVMQALGGVEGADGIAAVAEEIGPIAEGLGSLIALV